MKKFCKNLFRLLTGITAAGAAITLFQPNFVTTMAFTCVLCCALVAAILMGILIVVGEL